LADGATLSTDLDVGHDVVLNRDEDFDLVTAQWVMTFGANCRRFERATVTWALVMIKNDFAVEVFEAGHGVSPCLEL
jgi:hypothetical protein